MSRNLYEKLKEKSNTRLFEMSKQIKIKKKKIFFFLLFDLTTADNYHNKTILEMYATCPSFFNIFIIYFLFKEEERMIFSFY